MDATTARTATTAITATTATTATTAQTQTPPAHARHGLRWSAFRRPRWKVFGNAAVGRAAQQRESQLANLRDHARQRLAWTGLVQARLLRTHWKASHRQNLRHAHLSIFRAARRGGPTLQSSHERFIDDRQPGCGRRVFVRRNSFHRGCGRRSWTSAGDHPGEESSFERHAVRYAARGGGRAQWTADAGDGTLHTGVWRYVFLGSRRRRRLHHEAHHSRLAG